MPLLNRSILILGAVLLTSTLAATAAAATPTAPLRLRNRAQNLCLELPRTGARGGVVACTDGSVSDNLFRLDGHGRLRSAVGDRCVQPSGALAACSLDAGQQWNLVPRGSGWFGLQSRTSPGSCLVGAGASSLGVAACASEDSQQWSWESTGMALFNTLRVKRSLTAVQGGQCLGVKNGSKDDGAAIVVTPCNLWDARFSLRSLPGQTAAGDPLFSLRSLGSDKCVDIVGSAVEGAALKQASCDGTSSQQLALIDDPSGGVVLVTAGGKCLDFAGENAGAKVVLASCGAGPFAGNRRFAVSGARPARLRNLANNLCLDPPMWHGGDGPLSVAPCDAGRDQLFVINEDAELVSQAQGKCLDVAGNDAAKGAAIDLWKCEDKDDQAWKGVVTDGNFELRSKQSDLCVDLPGPVGKSGDPMILYGCNGGADQKWSWDHGAALGPVTPKVILAYTATGGGKGKVCAPGTTLCLSGNFTGDLQSGVFKASGDIVVDTPLGPWTLGDADLDVDLGTPRIAGQAVVTIPNLGFLTMSGTAFAADILIGRGGGTVGLASGTFSLDPAKFYVSARARVAAKYNMPTGGAPLKVDIIPDSIVLLEPTSPTVYLEGAAISMGPLASLLPAVDAIGFSLGDCFPYTLVNQLMDEDGKLAAREVCGNVLLSGQFEFEKIFYAKGTVVLDIDADGKDTTIFTGDTSDFLLALDGTGGLAKSIVELPFASASLYYDGRPGTSGRAEVAATCGKSNFFAGTPLEKVEFGGYYSQVWANLDEGDQRFAFSIDSPNLLGWKLANFDADMIWSGGKFGEANIKADLDLPYGDVDITGKFISPSSWSVTGTGKLDFYGATLATAKVTLGPAGTRIAGAAKYGGIAGFEVEGSIYASKDFELTAKTSVGGTGKFAGVQGSAKGEATLKIHRTEIDADFAGKIGFSSLPTVSASGDINSSGKVCLNLGELGSGCVDLSD